MHGLKFSLTMSFDVTKPKNKTKKSLTQLSSKKFNGVLELKDILSETKYMNICLCLRKFLA